MARENWLPALWGSREIDPFSMLRRQIDDIFNEAGFSPQRITGPAALRAVFNPQIDVCESEKDWTVTAELPGLDQDDIEVTMSGDVLTIRGEKHHEFEEGEPEENGQQQQGSGQQAQGQDKPAEQDQSQNQNQPQNQPQNQQSGSSGVIPTGQHTQGRQMQQRREEGGRVYHRVERSWGSFQRAIRVPFEIDPDRVEAKFRKGILTIKIPKPDKAQQQVKKIEIRSEGG